MELTVGKFLRFIITLIILAMLGWLLYALSHIITIIVISALIAYILDPIASYLEARGLSRLTATVIVFVCLIGLFAVIGWVFIPGLFSDLYALQTNLTREGGEQILPMLELFIQENLSFLDVESLNLKEKINGLISAVTDEMLAILANMISIISVIVIVPFVVFFLLKDGREMKKLFIYSIPNRYFEMALNVLHKIDRQLGGYLRGQFLEAFVVGTLAVIALMLLDVKYAIIIGIFAGLANMIPYVGPVAGAVPALIVSTVNDGGTWQLLYIVLAFALIQLIDNVLLQPLVLSRSVNLHPLIIVFAVLIGGQFFGVLGMLLAVPAAGIIKVTSSELYNGIRKFRLI